MSRVFKLQLLVLVALASLTSSFAIERVQAEQRELLSKSADDEPSLEATLKFIQDKVNSDGAVSAVVYFHDDAAQNDWSNQLVMETHVADAGACTIDNQERLTLNGKPAASKTPRLNLKDVIKISVITLEQSVTDDYARSGAPSYSIKAEPEVFVVDIQKINRGLNRYYFLDRGIADSVARAVRRASGICSNQADRPPDTSEGGEAKGFEREAVNHSDSGGIASSDEAVDSNEAKGKIPPVHDILSWISSKMVSKTSSTGTPISQSLTFQGCAATFTFIIEAESNSGASVYKVYLASLAPDAATVYKFDEDHQRILVNLHSDLGFTLHMEGNLGREAVKPMDKRETDIRYYVDDLNLAERMTRAWRDAITSCKGPDVPKDLY